MTATLTTVSAGLKEIYEGKINTQFSEEVTALKRLERTSAGVIDTVGGKYVTFPVRTRRNPGISYRAEGGALAAAGQQSYAAATVSLKYGYGRFEFTGQVMDLAESNPQAFADMADEEMNRLKDDLVKDSGRVAWGDVNNGVITMINDTATSADHVVLSVDNLEEGMIVDVLVASSGSATGGGTGLTINAINEATLTVTFSSSIGATTTGHGVYRAGNRGLEPTGLQQIVRTSGAIYGIDPATVSLWKSNNVAGGAATVDELKMIKACDLSRKKGGKVSVIFTSLGVRRAYFNTMINAQRRFMNTKEFPGGFTGLPFNYGTEIPVVEDVQAPQKIMWFLDESKIKIYRKKGWYFEDADGSVLKWVTGYDKFEGLAKQYWEFGTSQRNAHTLYDNILES